MLKNLFLETRPQFLILDFVLAILGTSVAAYDGYFNIFYALLALLGLILTHISVNTLNDYFDYKSGIDLATTRTPFSGGSGMIPSGRLLPKYVLIISIVSLILAIPIGIYFIIIKGWLLLPLLLVATLCVLLYTNMILKTPFPEWAAGLGLGLLPIMGFYFIQTGYYSWHCVIAGIPSFILVYNLLFLNEFPDVDADKIGNRRTFPIMLGRKAASINYCVMNILLYIWVIIWLLLGKMPLYVLLVLFALPFTVKAIKGANKFYNLKDLVSGMANNVLVVMLFQLLMGIGYVLGIYF